MSSDRRLADLLRSELLRAGAALVGYGGLSEVPEAVRQGLPVGVCVALAYQKDTIRGIREFPTPAYFREYEALNESLDALVETGAKRLRAAGYRAIAQTRAAVGDAMFQSPLPHKTVATRSGIGWIGKCALLVTEEYGSMIRLSSLLTDAPLPVATPIDASKCGDCDACQKACPAGAIHGRAWRLGLERDAFLDAKACRAVARQRAHESLGKEITLCGRCIEACPYTQRYLRASV